MLGLALLAEATSVFVHVRARGGSLARLHGSSLGAAGAWQTGSPADGAIAVLALPIAVLVYALAISASAPLGLLELPDTSPNQESWGGAWLTIVVFSVWTPALIATTWIYRLRTRLTLWTSSCDRSTTRCGAPRSHVAGATRWRTPKDDLPG